MLKAGDHDPRRRGRFLLLILTVFLSAAAGDQINNRRIAEFSTYPNPFNPETMVTYESSDRAVVNIAVYNSLGQRVANWLTATNRPVFTK